MKKILNFLLIGVMVGTSTAYAADFDWYDCENALQDQSSLETSLWDVPKKQLISKNKMLHNLGTVTPKDEAHQSVDICNFEPKIQEATDYADHINDDVSEMDFSQISKKIVQEIKEAREENVKIFALNDGQILMAKYSVPVHYLDDNGRYRDIYGASKTSHLALAELSGDQKIVTVSRPDRDIFWGYANANQSSLEEINQNHFTYRNVYNDVDLEYKFLAEKLQEHLILNSPEAQSEFIVTYQLNGLVPEQIDETTIQLLDENYRPVFTISAPEMFDSNGEYSDDLRLNIVNQENGRLTVSISCDYTWLNDPKRAYPVTIDPDYRDEEFDLLPCYQSGYEAETRYRKKDMRLKSSVFLDLRAADFGKMGFVEVSVWGRRAGYEGVNCTNHAVYYMLEAGHKYELWNSVSEDGFDEVKLCFRGYPDQRIKGKWSPDFADDSECFVIGRFKNNSRGNTKNSSFYYVLDSTESVWTQFRTKVNCSSVYLNLEDCRQSGTVDVRIWGYGGQEHNENCTNDPALVYTLELGRKYELYNLVNEHCNTGVALEISGKRGQKIEGYWSPDYLPEDGCITIGGESSASDSVAIRPIYDDVGIQGVPIISQLGLCATGCEAVSATMLLNFLGQRISVTQFIDNYLPKVSLANGPDPNSAFVGSPYDPHSFGCFAPCIAKSMNRAIDDWYRAEVVRGKSLSYLTERYVKHGVPVLIWATMGMKKPSPGHSWIVNYVDENAEYSPGERFTWPKHEHCLVLVGADEDDYFVHDPLQPEEKVRGAYDRRLLDQRFDEMGRQAVVVFENPAYVPEETHPSIIPAIFGQIDDFMKGFVGQTAKNVAEPIFVVVGSVTGDRDLYNMVHRAEALHVGDQTVYVMGKVTSDVVSAVGGALTAATGVATIAGGITGEIGGAIATSTGAGVLAGVPTMVISGSAIAVGVAEVGAGVGVCLSSLGNLGDDLAELQENFNNNSSLNLVNCMKMKTSQALDAAGQFLGEGYKDLGNGRFVSRDGLRQVRMGDADILGHHAGGSHMNFEELIPNPVRSGKLQVKTNYHIFLID